MSEPAATKPKLTLLIYAPVPLFRVNDALYLERQACNGLRLWAENFEKLLVMMPLEAGEPPEDWVSLNTVGPSLERIEIHPLPSAYRPDKFIWHYQSVKRQIVALIDRSDYRSFAIGGLFGDWGSVACLQAYRRKKLFAVWTDRVESSVMRKETQSGSFKHRIRARLYHRPMAALERYIVRRATLGLFHGRDTYDAYAPFCRTPVLVHDIHISKKDHIRTASLASKIENATNGPLRLCYVGRADSMKGPLDWVEVLRQLDNQKVDFRATWLGDGDDYAQMKQRITELKLADRVTLPGFTNDRALVLDTLREAHVFLFCHKTPESPRCLIEALASGCPIIGYASAFAEDLISVHQGGRLTPVGDITGLSNVVAELAQDRTAMADLISRAAKDGSRFDDVAVFRHRSEAIKANL